MKTKTTLKLTIFATTLIVSLTLVNSIFCKNPISFLTGKDNFKERVNVYNFLLADKARWEKWHEKSVSLQLQPKPDSMRELLKEREKYNKELLSERINADTSALPEDFKEAWSNYLKREKFILSVMYPEKPKSSDSILMDSREMEMLAKAFENVANDYGFELNQSFILLNKES